MLFVFRVVHERAGAAHQEASRRGTPLTVSEIQADKDALRAQFAMSVRRPDIGVEEMRAKTATWHDGVGKHTANSAVFSSRWTKRRRSSSRRARGKRCEKTSVRRMAKILLYITCV
jgi:hypothetical protein